MAEKVPLEPVESSNLAAYGYDAARRWLDVQFKSSGDIMRYTDVPLELAQEFGAAGSKGKFYASRVRGQFTADKMTGPCPACGDRGWVGDECTDCGTQRYIREERAQR
jgi:hypothetical protein